METLSYEELKDIYGGEPLSVKICRWFGRWCAARRDAMLEDIENGVYVD